ncbi:alpha/beta hydrolase [Euzebya tangerina]|uniref:alpha/beta hydrolase n=1 Tax=Euzebya tangerina TaxID=591198 RepID=UPI000E319E7B|nr:alpha/beta hydrolase [Euzebya tangerina]
MTLDPATAQFIRDAEAVGRTPYQDLPTAADARQQFRTVALERRGGGPAPGPECSTEMVSRDGLWCRIYRPLGRSVHAGPMPLVVFFHGGGWVIGDLDTHDAHARALTALPAVVVSVEYRLAPESPYPAAHEDCWDWLLWAASGMGEWSNTNRLVVAGDSAGGLLAASMAERCRDRTDGPDLAAQCLIYPAMNVAMDTPSHAANGSGYQLTAELMRWFYDQYQPGEGFSPTESDDLSGLAPAVIATAGYDPLADDGINYGNALRAAGVTTTNVHFDGLIHGFFGMGGTSPAAQAAVEATVGALRGLL